jgi:hypothetical protein
MSVLRTSRSTEYRSKVSLKFGNFNNPVSSISEYRYMTGSPRPGNEDIEGGGPCVNEEKIVSEN